ncbi:uroporphyrinogen decarboxylase [Pseudohyphozyma bogoriensis]|nr:uroporphyrinogen decarboxylase [Pseudohyphozyma bogoriensis]
MTDKAKAPPAAQQSEIDHPTPVTSYTFPDLSTLPPLKNDLLLRSALNEPPTALPNPPIWVMRQAGRYLPEFLELRKDHSFFTVCRTPALACELTMQPIRRYDGLLDAAIIFSDILVVPQAMGMEVQMLPGKGPHFPSPLENIKDAEERILNKETDVFAELSYVYAAITLTRQTLDGKVPLIGFCAAPWTLFGYMIEGGGSKTWEKAKRWLYREPESAKAILKKIAEVSAEYLVGQVRAGAQLLQVFDTNADILSHAQFTQFILPYTTLIATLVRSKLTALNLPLPPMTIFSKGSNHPSQLLALSKSGYNTLGLDWGISAREAREATNGSVCLQGNLDPPVLQGGKKAIKEEVREMCWGKDGFMTCAKEGLGGGWIVNLGHGITPGVDPEDMRYFLERVRKETRKKSADEAEADESGAQGKQRGVRNVAVDRKAVFTSSQEGNEGGQDLKGRKASWLATELARREAAERTLEDLENGMRKLRLSSNVRATFHEFEDSTIGHMVIVSSDPDAPLPPRPRATYRSPQGTRFLYEMALQARKATRQKTEAVVQEQRSNSTHSLWSRFPSDIVSLATAGVGSGFVENMEESLFVRLLREDASQPFDHPPQDALPNPLCTLTHDQLLRTVHRWFEIAPLSFIINDAMLLAALEDGTYDAALVSIIVGITLTRDPAILLSTLFPPAWTAVFAVWSFLSLGLPQSTLSDVTDSLPLPPATHLDSLSYSYRSKRRPNVATATPALQHNIQGFSTTCRTLTLVVTANRPNFSSAGATVSDERPPRGRAYLDSMTEDATLHRLAPFNKRADDMNLSAPALLLAIKAMEIICFESVGQVLAVLAKANRATLPDEAKTGLLRLVGDAIPYCLRLLDHLAAKAGASTEMYQLLYDHKPRLTKLLQDLLFLTEAGITTFGSNHDAGARRVQRSLDSLQSPSMFTAISPVRDQSSEFDLQEVEVFLMEYENGVPGAFLVPNGGM